MVNVDSRWSLQRDENGVPTAILELGRDMTQHVAAEEMLRESNERFYQAFEHALIGKALLSPDGRWLRVNRALTTMFGYTSEELIGRSFLEVTHPDDLNVADAERRELLDGRIDSYQLEKRYIRKNGELLWGMLSASLVRDAHHQPLYFIAEIEDATERHKTLQSLAEQHSLLETVLENMADGLTVTDSAGNVLIRNRISRNLFGSKRNTRTKEWSEAYGLYQADQQTLVDYRDLPACRVMSGEPSAELEMWIRNEITPKGAWVYVQSRAFLRPDGSPRGVITVIHDITRQKEMETELEWSHARAAENARLSALGMMAGGIAHEINNPLGIIHASASNLLDMVESGDAPLSLVHRDSARIVQTAERIAKIVTSLRHVSREGSSDPFVDVAVRDIVKVSLDFCRERFKMRSVTLVCPEIDPALTVLCREVQISQVLLNLLQNALDSVETLDGERVVKVEVITTPPWRIISVLDNGPGFSPEAKKFAMDPFFTTKPVGKGTGLGLSISSTIAASHGGKLELYQRDGLTCVTLVLPYTEKDPGHA